MWINGPQPDFFSVELGGILRRGNKLDEYRHSELRDSGSTQVFDGFDLNRVARTIQGTSDLNLFPYVFSKLLVITVVIEEVVLLPRPIVDYERRLPISRVFTSGNFTSERLFLRLNLLVLALWNFGFGKFASSGDS
jgi:hypothetical protein